MIEDLALENFRNYEKAFFKFGPTTVIIGKNGVGKTSILEAISMLSMTTSWKTEKDSEVVRWDQSFARVTSDLRELVIQVHPYLKRIKIDGVSKRTFQVIGLFPTTLFQPDDLQLIYGSPTMRRHYLDRVISQTSTAYTEAIIELNQVLKQRNRLLKNIQEGMAGRSELLFWNQELARLQQIIQIPRQSFVDHLNRLVPRIFAEMINEGGAISIAYLRSPKTDEHSFLQHLEQQADKEIMVGVSLYGPHREDIALSWGEHLVQQSMSRGQTRSLLVAFKIAELEYITQQSGIKPVLLLDDIFSELDAERRERLFNVLGEYQVIMTTTELGNLQGVLQPNTQIIDLEKSDTILQ